MEGSHGPTASGDRAPPSRIAPSLFERFEEGDAVDLLREYPLAWVCARDGAAPHASLLPLLPEFDRDGRLCGLLGHMARHNALAGALARDPRALILVSGPQGYVSPEWVSDRSWAPTWNYAQLRLEAEVRFEEAGADHALARLVEAMEDGRARPWRIGEMGPRYDGMARAIIAFRARIIRLEGRFKLGQDERPEILRELLRNRPADDLSRWMRRFNAARLGGEIGEPAPGQASAASRA